MRITAPIEARLLVAVALALAGCATLHRSEARSTEELLAEAGFQAKPANTLEKLVNLEAMPPRKLMAQRRDLHPIYSYADPDNCRCLYVGGPKEYTAFQRLSLDHPLADDAYIEVMDFDLWGPWAW